MTPEQHAPENDGARLPVVDVIRDAIRQRLLAPGAPLVQSALADALGVSKIPVREALHALASEGLVTFSDDGARVTSLSPAEIHELWSLRALVEPSLAEAIVRNAGPADVARIRRRVAEMDEVRDGDAWSDLNYAFHLDLYALAGMPHTAGVASRVLTLIEPHSRVAVNRLAGREAAQAEHRQMVAALERGDAEELRDVLVRHSTRARDLLVDYAVGETGERAAAPVSEAARAFATRLAGNA